ncbi:MAG: hypothetical protein H7123_03640 [Thermoleophilia bacterium]|nr:hypothetical protein [Thermoleophilia bacterium]
MTVVSRKVGCAFTAIAFAGTALPASAAAHGIKIRADLPVPLNIFYTSGAIILVVSFLMLLALWRKPRFTTAPWRALPPALSNAVLSPITRRAAAALVLACFVLVVVAALGGTVDGGDNIAPTIVFLHWWIGIPVASALLGDVVRRTIPWATIARLGGIGDEPVVRTRSDPGYWPAAVTLLTFSWLELVYPTAAHVRMIGVLAVTYLVVTVAAMVVRGVEGWLDGGELFATYGSTIARLSIWECRTQGDGSQRLGLRPPLIGALQLRPRPGLAAFTTLLIGTVSYDGLSRTHWWTLRVADATARLSSHGISSVAARYIFGTFGLVAMSLFAWGAFELAAWLAGRLGGFGGSPHPVYGRPAAAFAPTLVPIALAYVVAHYFTYFWFGGQTIIPLASDPLGRGWNLFGTLDYTIDFSTIRANTVWYVQVGAIVIGHVAGLALAHDRALELAPNYRRATISQLAMLALMVLYTVGGLYFLSGGLA